MDCSEPLGIILWLLGTYTFVLFHHAGVLDQFPPCVEILDLEAHHEVTGPIFLIHWARKNGDNQSIEIQSSRKELAQADPKL